MAENLEHCADEVPRIESFENLLVLRGAHGSRREPGSYRMASIIPGCIMVLE